jgi:multiple sugar transport system permease protein
MTPAQARRRIPQLRLTHVAAYAVLVTFAIVFLTPYVWAVFESFKSNADAGSQGLLPHTWTLDNYGSAFNFSYPPYVFKPDYVHSAIVALGVALATLLTSTLVGFVLAVYRFRGKEILFILLIVAFMVPFTGVMVPLYVTVVRLGLDNSLGALIVTGLWSPFGILVMRQFLEGIPTDMLEAARIDGAGEWRLVARMILPLCTPALGILAIYTFMHSWDDYLWPTIILHDPAKWTLPLLISYFTNSTFPTPFVMAVAMLTILPVLIVYALVARFFVRGIGAIALHV